MVERVSNRVRKPLANFRYKAPSYPSDEVTVRVRRHSDALAALRPLTFATGDIERDVVAAHLFSESNSIVLSVVTGAGTVTLKLTAELARRIAAGLTELTEGQ
jgi:hypothetical protein